MTEKIGANTLSDRNSEKILPQTLTEIETAKYIGMSQSYLRQARVKGNLHKHTPAPPFIKIGRSVRYLKVDLDSWLNAQKKLEHLNQQ